MTEQLIWALRQAREQTQALVADLPADAMCGQSAPGEHHPTWILGHLLLADSYLLYLLELDPLPRDFENLLEKHGPGATPTADPNHYDAKEVLTERLTETNARRLDGVRALSPEACDRPLTDSRLAEAQPTIGHHLHSQVFHEGYHSGQIAAWRRARGLPSVRWALGPRGR